MRYNRFKDVAKLHGWDETEKLGELLPKLQGNAASFMYELLSPATRTNYKQLVQELKHEASFMVQFSKRDQKQGESIEEYAAELKRLYDKAHSS